MRRHSLIISRLLIIICGINLPLFGEIEFKPISNDGQIIHERSRVGTLHGRPKIIERSPEEEERLRKEKLEELKAEVAQYGQKLKPAVVPKDKSRAINDILYVATDGHHYGWTYDGRWEKIGIYGEVAEIAAIQIDGGKQSLFPSNVKLKALYLWAQTHRRHYDKYPKGSQILVDRLRAKFPDIFSESSQEFVHYLFDDFNLGRGRNSNSLYARAASRKWVRVQQPNGDLRNFDQLSVLSRNSVVAFLDQAVAENAIEDRPLGQGERRKYIAFIEKHQDFLPKNPKFYTQEYKDKKRKRQWYAFLGGLKIYFCDT